MGKLLKYYKKLSQSRTSESRRRSIWVVKGAEKALSTGAKGQSAVRRCLQAR